MDSSGITIAGAGKRPASIRPGLWAKPLLPNEPRIRNPVFERALTEQYLLPVLAELEACFLAVRTQLDPELQRLQPMKAGKPYPLGQCLEIAQAVEQRLRRVDEASLSPGAARGLRALRAFQRAGGSFRQVWGDLRGQYFQNAFQLGCLYVDVSNDTVVITKPKVEVLPFEQAQFIPVEDFTQFRHIAARYWQDKVYPNHVLPTLAPHCPLIHVSQTGRIHLHDATQYMLAMTRMQKFAPSEALLYENPMPSALFARVCRALQGSGYSLPRSAEHGRQQALRNCRLFRARRWHREPRLVPKIIQDVGQLNLHLARWHNDTISQETAMATITIDNTDYNTDTFNDAAKQNLKMLQMTEQEIQRLQLQLAIAQTARNAYANALKQNLPTPLEQIRAQGDTLNLG
jgi:hypothetical protein